MRRDQLAINSITTRQADLPAAVAAYAAAGFRQAEFHLPLVRSWLDQGHTESDAVALLEGHGLRSIGGFELAFQAFAPEAERADNHQRQRANAELIHALGGGTLVVGMDGPAVPSVDALDVLAGEIAAFAATIADLDVRIALEFNWGPLVRSLASAVAVCERVDRANVGVLFDPAHYHCTPTKAEHLDARTIPWIAHVHVDDMADIPGELSHCNDDRRLPGEGILDLPDLFGRIERGGYTGSFSIEMFSAELWALSAEEAARRSYRSLLPLCDGE